MKKVLKVGLIGLGKMGQNHLRILSMLKSVDLKFIYDLDIDTLNRLSKQYGIKASNDLENDLKIVDAVVIVTPTSTHFEYIKLATQFVKNIFVEKPLSVDYQSALNIEQIVKEKNIKLQVGFIERFNPAVVELKKVLSYSKEIINIDFVRTNKISNRITDVDVVSDLMIHDIDLAIYLNGKIKNIVAYGKLDNGMIGYARATLKHQNGAFSNITASRITEKIIRQIDVTANNMFIDCNLFKKEIFINRQSIVNDYSDIQLSSIQETVFVPPIESLLTELLHFVDFCLEENINTTAIPQIESGVESIRVVAEIQKQILEDNQ